MDEFPKDRKAKLVYCPDRQNVYLVSRAQPEPEANIEDRFEYFGGSGALTETPVMWMEPPVPYYVAVEFSTLDALANGDQP